MQCKTKLPLSKTKVCETQGEEGILKLPGVWCVAASPFSAFSAGKSNISCRAGHRAEGASHPRQALARALGPPFLFLSGTPFLSGLLAAETIAHRANAL